MSKSIRPYRPADENAVVQVWHRAGIRAYHYLPTWQTFTLEQAQLVFREHILPHCELWVGTEQEKVVAYLALKDAFIDRLYVDPIHQGQGWGNRLLEQAKTLYPQGLELYTHQQNLNARCFYEKHGFVAVQFGISPPPESAPDVLYRWCPGRGAWLVNNLT